MTTVGRVGQAIPGYELKAKLGEGGAGVVYRARRTATDREVALKILHAGDADPEAEARFVREQRLLVEHPHPNLVPVLNCGVEVGLRWLAMELVPGAPLAAGLDAGRRLSAADALRAARALAAGLAHLHGLGIVHRGLRPSSVLVDDVGTLAIADAGLAAPAHASLEHASLAHASLEHGGAPAGTLAYLAPEVARGEEPGPAADVYALGVMLYELAAGRLPYRADDLSGWLRAIASAPVAPLSDPAVPPALAALIDRALSRPPGARPTAAALSEALDALPLPEQSGSRLASLSSVPPRASWRAARQLPLPAVLPPPGAARTLAIGLAAALAVSAAMGALKAVRARYASPAATSGSPR